jgi:hypothetical protein
MLRRILAIAELLQPGDTVALNISVQLRPNPVNLAAIRDLYPK